jgi:hypothetical protein
MRRSNGLAEHDFKVVCGDMVQIPHGQLEAMPVTIGAVRDS